MSRVVLSGLYQGFQDMRSSEISLLSLPLRSFIRLASELGVDGTVAIAAIAGIVVLDPLIYALPKLLTVSKLIFSIYV